MTLMVHALLVVGAILVLGISHAHAGYRVTFSNGTSIEVQAYEDLGDAIRYPRLGGTVSVPKGDVLSIEEAVHHPAPEKPAPAAAPVLAPPATGPGTGPPAKAAARPDRSLAAPPELPWPAAPVLALPGRQAGNTPITLGIIHILTAIALVVAVVAAVLFFVPGRSRSPYSSGSGRQRAGRNPGRPLGVVLVGIYDVLFGFTAISVGMGGALLGGFLGELPVFLVPADGPVAVVVVSLMTAVFGAVMLATAYGMWSLQAWGRRLQAVICMIDIPLEAFGLLVGNPSAMSLISVAVLFIDGAILIYISRPDVERRYLREEWDDEDEPVTEDEPSIPSL